ncbi:MAG: hypothetical protein JJ971_13075 [Balneolaceae bacterium]|nr:hypothetical protein [Balneolaceae bacterium]MBO6547214.1 hypothetical protein [Balneolaceae bacterium]MBO6647839.1 hypothetical protein [Balneolaceae bacterium]
MKKIISSITFFALLLLLFQGVTVAQVTISPTNLFIDDNAQFGSYMVINGSNEAQEISIDFFFAYSQSDETGTRGIVQNDTEREEEFSIADNVRAFPRNFTLAPGQRQTVRLRVSGTNELPDGTYWSRIKTTSTPETPPLEIQSNDAVTARVGIRVEQVTGLFFKKGNVTTGIDIVGIETNTENEGNTLNVLVDHLRTGNSPFLGTITTEILNAQGRTVLSDFVSTSIYFDGIFKQQLNIQDLQPGNYRVRVTFESDRNDIDRSRLVQMPTSTQTVPLSIR